MFTSCVSHGTYCTVLKPGLWNVFFVCWFVGFLMKELPLFTFKSLSKEFTEWIDWADHRQMLVVQTWVGGDLHALAHKWQCMLANMLQPTVWLHMHVHRICAKYLWKVLYWNVSGPQDSLGTWQTQTRKPLPQPFCLSLQSLMVLPWMWSCSRLPLRASGSPGRWSSGTT